MTFLDAMKALAVFLALVALVLFLDSGPARSQVRDTAAAREIMATVQPTMREGCAAYLAGRPRPAMPGPSNGDIGPKGFRKPSAAQMRQVYAHSGWLACRHHAQWIAGGRSRTLDDAMTIICNTSVFGSTVMVTCR